MPTNNDYRAYLEEKFTGVNVKLDNIHTQVLKTNGRVNEHDVRLNLLEKEDISHTINCPQKARIDNIDESLMEYKMAKKYPKFFVVAFWIFGAILILTACHSFGLF